MQIFIRCRSGAIQALDVVETDVVERVRQKVKQTELYYPSWHDWRLMVGEVELRCDDKRLADYHVKDGMVLELCQRSHVNIGIRCPPSGRVHTVVCEITDRIFDCKKKFRDSMHQVPISTRQAWLLPDGDELADFITVSDYGLTSGIVLDMAIREPLPIRIAVKTEDGRAFWLDIDEWDTIGEIRDKVGARGCLDDALASIIYGTEELDDDEQFFGAYGIPDSSTLYLNERRLGERIAARAPVAETVPPPSMALLRRT